MGDADPVMIIFAGLLHRLESLGWHERQQLDLLRRGELVKRRLREIRPDIKLLIGALALTDEARTEKLDQHGKNFPSLAIARNLAPIGNRIARLLSGDDRWNLVHLNRHAHCINIAARGGLEDGLADSLDFRGKDFRVA